MRRREFIAGLGAAAWPVVARAQQAKLPVIGFLNSETADLSGDRLRGLRQGLGETGYVEGRNVAIEYRWAQGSAAGARRRPGASSGERDGGGDRCSPITGLRGAGRHLGCGNRKSRPLLRTRETSVDSIASCQWDVP
jgi:hypothetical protein